MIKVRITEQGPSPMYYELLMWMLAYDEEYPPVSSSFRFSLTFYNLGIEMGLEFLYD